MQEATGVRVNYKSKYIIRRPGNWTYGDYPGDAGLIIPKLLNLGKDEQLVRLGFIEEYRRKDAYECPGCGNKFARSEARDEHYRKRHGDRRQRVVNFEELTDEQKEAVLRDVTSSDQRDPAYWVQPGEFGTMPDPDDQRTVAEEKRAEETAPLYLDKTKAARK